MYSIQEMAELMSFIGQRQIVSRTGRFRYHRSELPIYPKQAANSRRKQVYRVKSSHDHEPGGATLQQDNPKAEDSEKSKSANAEPTVPNRKFRFLQLFQDSTRKGLTGSSGFFSFFRIQQEKVYCTRNSTTTSLVPFRAYTYAEEATSKVETRGFEG
jgi:hypothetical protein